MNKVYYNFYNCSSNFNKFFASVDSSLSKNQINFLGDFFSALINSSSINFDNIALELSHIYPNINFDSILKRISRFLNNPKYDFHHLFDNVIYHIFNNFNVKHDDNRVFISFDHMFVKDKFTVFALSLKLGKQGIPIYFNVFPGKYDIGFDKAFSNNVIFDSITYIHNLFKSIDPNINIVWLADRWFGNNFPLFNYIDNVLHDYFVFRLKNNFKILYFDPKENHKIWTNIYNLPNYKYHSNFFIDLEFTKNKYKFNLTICKSDNHKERWFIISNVDPTRVKKFYAYRFGGIETIFKNEKSNGFYLEKTGIKHLHTFDNLYSLLSIAVVYLTSLGADVSKNSRCYKNLGFRTVRKNSNNKVIRLVSLFKTGLRLFKLAFNSTKYYRLPFSFKLYDI